VSRVGILGGTFNPPHVGHVVCAREARDQLGLDCVLLMPVFAPPHKPMPDEPGTEHRLALCRLAVEGERGLQVSALEIERGGPSYTVDTLRELDATRPEDELTWIAGGDMAASLPSWREPEVVLSLARFAVAEREGADRERIERALGSLAGRESVVFFDMPRIDVSSSMVRARVAAGRPIEDLVPEAVARYIAEHGLYRSAVATG
jgi:nicotinate-nucleotide adenylyltransferase